MNSAIHPYYFSRKKRIFDLMMVIIMLIPVMVVSAIVAIAMIGTMGFPLIFQQKRAGKNNKSFFLYKLRTMKLNANKLKKKYLHLNQAPKPMFKIFDDPRFEKLGRTLSKTGLDELPQLMNILRGDMSFIGPRPLPVEEAKKLDASWHFRHAVKPGLFSEWTISENRHQSLESWKNLDKKTLSNGGIWYDLSLIAKTIIKVLSNH